MAIIVNRYSALYREEGTLKKILIIIFLGIFLNVGISQQFYPAEQAALNELILTNNLIQPYSNIPITLESAFLLNYFEFGSTTIETIETEENCTTTFCRIVSIDFTNYNITTIPESFNQFIMLKSLTLKNNNIEEIPIDLYNLNNIEHLDLSINQINELQYGIGSFTSLEYLNISSNNLTVLPESISLLPVLSYLDISQNSLTEFNFNNLPNIETLFINGNKISELEESFCDININWADYNNIVMDNHLCSNIPSCLSETNTVGPQDCNESQRGFLQTIISQNGLNEFSSSYDYDNNDSDFEPIELGYQRWELGQIVELNLSSNPFNNIDYGYDISYFPDNLTEITSLKKLDLGNNQLTYIPSDIGLLTDLISLKFDNNFISGNLTSGGVPSEIGLLGDLEVLSLAHNFLTIPNPAIYSLINLEELYLNNNQIYYIDNDLGNLEELKILKLNNNDISSLPNEIRFLDHLINLNASFNQLISFNDNLRYLGTLKYLDLANNYIQEVPSAISQMLNLRELKLNNNQLYDIPNEIFDLGLLRKLHLHYNSLHQLSDDIGDLAHLEELKLHYNLLHELPWSICSIDIDFNQSANEINNYLSLQQNFFCFNLPYCIGNHDESQEIIGEQDCYGSDIQVITELLELNEIIGNPANLGVWENERLVELNLSNQDISVLPENLGYLAELRNLNLSNNSISIIPESIGYLVQLDSLKLSNNLIEHLPEEFNDLEQLKLLDLSSNLFSDYPIVLNDLTSLNKLDISFNSISELPETINELEDLDRLILAGNLLSSIPEDIGDLESLIELNLSNNELVILPNELGNLIQLSIFSIDNNDLDSIPPIFDQLINLTNLNISNNNIVELQNDFFGNSELENINLSNNNLLRLPESICYENNAQIDLSNNYLYCVLGLDSDQYYGYMDEIMIPDCIDDFTNIDGLTAVNQGCEYYGCTEAALNYDENALMSCSSDGTYSNLNDCCLYVEGPDIYVRPNNAILFPGSDVSGDGSFESPFASIDKAVNLAGRNHRVIVDAGEYFESVNVENKDAVSIVSNAIFETDENLQNYYLENTIINGNNFGSCFNILNSGDSGNVEILGLTLKNGRSDFGGGVKIENSNVLIDNVILTENTGTINGGGIFVGGISDVNIYNSVIDTNISVTGTGFGGGVYAENNSSIYLKNTEITRNKSNSGGGLYLNNNNQVTIDKCKIKKNLAINNGGGIFNTNDSLQFLHFIDNSNGDQDTVITYIEQNIARYGAGTYHLNNSSALNGLIISNNIAEENGGGIYVESPNYNNQFSNLIITHNIASSGSGIYVENSDLKLYHITFYKNIALDGSLIFIGENSDIDIVNSILWNTDSEDLISIDESSTIALNHSILSSEYTGNNNHYQNPEFSSLSNFNLSRVSIALGTGLNDENIPSTDIFGNPRILSSEDVGVNNPDIGATEFHLGSIQFYDWFVSFNGSDNYSGLDPDEPFKRINYAINNSLNGDRIYIKNGTYNENIVFNGKNVKLMNHEYYSMSSIGCADIAESSIESLIIEGESNSPVVQILEGEDNVELCGLTIKDGEANLGAGIQIINANPKLSNLHITDNYSFVNGGGIYADNFNGELNNLKISDNMTAGDGSGLYLINSSPILKNLVISENENRVGNNNLDGAGMYIGNSHISTFESIQFENNYASKNGGGLYLNNSIVDNAVGLEFISNNSNQNGGAIYSINSEITFSGNFVTNFLNNYSNINGGGIYLKSGKINGSHVSLIANSSNLDGGAIFIDDGGELKLTDSDIYNNSSLEDGGAININGYNTILDLEYCEVSNNYSETSSILYANNGEVRIKNTLIDGNNSNNYPGGILAKNSNISLLNVTLSDNTVIQPGAGGNLNIEQYGSLKLINSIVWDNDGVGVYLRDDGYPKSMLATHSALSNGRSGIINSYTDSVYYYSEFNISADPKFISPEEGFYYITKESPCVDAGINLFPPNANATNDTILYIPESETVDGDGDGIALPDMGAYDKRVLSVYPGDLNNDGIVNTDDVLGVVLYFNYSGIPRYSKGIHWNQNGHGAIAWDNHANITGAALTYADANGDGVINERDVLAIGLNWENEHVVDEPGLLVTLSDDELVQNYSIELNLIYNSLSGAGEGITQIKIYLEKLLNISSLPIVYSLDDNYPNPFNPVTDISFSLPKDSNIDLNIYNIKGELIEKLIQNKTYRPGYHSVQFNASNLSSGIYFYNIKAGNWEQTKKMMLVK